MPGCGPWSGGLFLESGKSLMARIFVLSTGRTGTLYLARMLARSNPDLPVVHETSGSRTLNILSGMCLTGLPVGALLRSQWNRVFGKKGESFFEPNNMVWAAFAMSGDMQPTDRVLHIVRDPRTYAVSHRQLGKARWKSALANWTPFWQPGTTIFSNLRIHGHLRKYAVAWQLKNSYISEKYEQLNYCCLRYEDLFSDVASTRNDSWNKLSVFTGLKLPPHPGDGSDRVNSSSGGAHWRAWPQEQRQIVDKVCGELAREYGYCSEPEWVQTLG